MNHISFKSIVDFMGRVFNKANSRKFIVWVTGTVALFTDFVGAEQWMAISLLYVGAESALDWRGLVRSSVETSIANRTREEVPEPVDVQPS